MLLTVACAQFCSAPDPAENLATMRALAQQAADLGARLIVFPEASMAPFTANLAAVAQPWDGAFADGVRAVAVATGVAVVAGMFVPSSDARVTNTLIATDGTTEARYDKIHLYDALGHRESDTVAPGSDIVTVTLAGVRVGLATCYDVRFADQFTALGRAGADVIVLPASWGDGPGKVDQWQLLTRARAHDSQAWLLACDQAWTPPRGTAPLGVGHSQIIDPRGQVVVRAEAGPELLIGEIDTSLCETVRKQVPILGADAAR